MTDFPILTAKLTATKIVMFNKAVTIVAEAVAAGQITNPVYNDVKFTISGVLDNAYRDAVLSNLTKRGTYPADVEKMQNDIYYTHPALHTVAGHIRKIEALKTAIAIKAAALAVLHEIAPVAANIQTLKTMIVKRQPKPVEDRKAKYNAPDASLTAIGIVKALLEEITEAARNELIATFERRFNSMLSRFADARTKAEALGKNPPSVYDVFASHKADYRDPEGYQIVSSLVQQDSASFNLREIVRPDAATIITKLATDHADNIRENFVYKNLKKLDSIVESKGNFVSGKIIGRKIEMGALRGTLRFTFADGSAFTVINNVVWSYSIYGKEFQRYPLTFHEVVLADGLKMGKPSEQRMNTIFVGKAG